MTSNERHRLSLIIATLGPSTDNERELITMLMAGIARQWTDGVDIARVLHSDGDEVAKNRIKLFREQSKKRNLLRYFRCFMKMISSFCESTKIISKFALEYKNLVFKSKLKLISSS